MITISQDNLACHWVILVKQIKKGDRSYSTLNPFEAFLLCLFHWSHLLNRHWHKHLSLEANPVPFPKSWNLVDLLKHIYPKHRVQASDIHMHSKCFILKCTNLYRYDIWSHNHPFWFQDNFDIVFLTILFLKLSIKRNRRATSFDLWNELKIGEI